MPEFLSLLPPADALARLLAALPLPAPHVEWLAIDAALGRVTGCAVIAPEPLPAFARSTVDGYAVQAAATYGASDGLPAYLELAGEVPMGAGPQITLRAGQAAVIHTGGMLPVGADAVVMLEQTQRLDDSQVEILRAVAPGENILLAGEDVAQGEVVISAGRRLRAAELGGLAALGIQMVCVRHKPRVAIISTGDELLPPEQTPGLGQVRDINSTTLSALVTGWGGETVRYGIIPDRRDALDEALGRALAECDLVIITAGSSASTRDLTADVINARGQPGVLAHGVNVRPGKPTILAVCGATPVIGLPGNPVSAMVIAGLFVRPVLEWLLGMPAGSLPGRVSARLSVNLPSQAGREEWTPAVLVHRAGALWAEPVFYKSNLIFNLARADGLIFTPADATGLAVGELVEVRLL